MAFFKKQHEDPEEKNSELDDLAREIKNAGLPPEVEEFAQNELKKMRNMDPCLTEYTIAINHLEFLLSLPWNKATEDNLDIQRAQNILDLEHFGLSEIKDRIQEHLAVRVLKSSRPHKILVVDDEPITCKNLAHVLGKEGYQVFSAQSGSEARDYLQEYYFDVLVTDLKMDDIDGLQLLELAKGKDASTEVIIITGYADVPTAVSAMQKGSSQFLSKPLELDELRSVVANAVNRKTAQLKTSGPILCFLGPPGTGKTSLGLSIASSLQREFIRISLAGVKDESQLRGHRRSYVGALPGKILQEIRRTGVKNPVFMLDEIDKLGQEFQGDPSSALLEILDPEQNKYFLDHYLDVPFDLSQVMFIATANSTEAIPEALQDRLEIINFPGYTEEDKEQIAFNYLIYREKFNSSLQDYNIQFTTHAVRKIIREYTREAGLRDLQRQIGSICRKLARQVLQHNNKPDEEISVTPDLVEELLGPPKYILEAASAKDRVGVATGLAWTPYGGKIIFIEATKMPGANNLILTGSLGDVLKESAQAALSYIRSNADIFKVDEDFFSRHDIHIHVPAGATPKDGPSAGIAIPSTATRTRTENTRRISAQSPVGSKERAGAGHVIVPRQALSASRQDA